MASEGLACALAIVGEMIELDEETVGRAFEAVALAPDQLTPAGREQIAQLAHRVAELLVTPTELLWHAFDLDLVTGLQQDSLAQFKVPSLPPARQTRARRMHDEMHRFMLDPHLKLLMLQPQIDKLLRSNDECDSFDILTFLNHISERLEDKQRFVMMEHFIVNEEQQAAQLFYLSARKQDVHAKLLSILLRAVEDGQARHRAPCPCLLHAHLRELDLLSQSTFEESSESGTSFYTESSSGGPASSSDGAAARVPLHRYIFAGSAGIATTYFLPAAISILSQMTAVDEATLARVLDAASLRPDQLSSDGRQRLLQLVHRVAELCCTPRHQLLHACSPDLISKLQQDSFAHFKVPPLPPEWQTRARRMHDEMHQLMLKPHPKLLRLQLEVDWYLRSNDEWEPLDILTLLNHTSECLTGKKSFMMMDEFAASKEQQAAQLFYLSARKPHVHEELMGLLFQGCEGQYHEDEEACPCLLHAHLREVDHLLQPSCRGSSSSQSEVSSSSSSSTGSSVPSCDFARAGRSLPGWSRKRRFWTPTPEPEPVKDDFWLPRLDPYVPPKQQ